MGLPVHAEGELGPRNVMPYVGGATKQLSSNHFWMVRCELGILNPHGIEIWFAEQQAPHDVIVEVLIGKPTNAAPECPRKAQRCSTNARTS